MYIVKIEAKEINEDFIPPDIAPDEQEVELCLDQVKSINSTGIRLWMQWLKLFPDKKFYFSKVRPVMVRQINVIVNFIPPNSVVTSLYVPYYNEETSDSLDRLAFMGKDFHERSVNLPSQFKSEDGKTWTIDCVPERYFGFILEKS